MIWILVSHYVCYFLSGIYYTQGSVDYELIKRQLLNLVFPACLLFVDPTVLNQDPTWDILKFPLWILMVDQLFYWIHRTFHMFPYLYSYHKRHHVWFEPVAFSALDSHIVEHICANLFPVLFPIYVLGISYYGCVFLVGLASVNTVKSHTVDYGPYHSNHHKFQHYNYGLDLVADRLYGTFLERK